MTTKRELATWYDEGVAQGASHMIVFVDTYSYEDYPVFTKTVEEAKAKIASCDSMQRVMEIYNLSMDKDTQLAETRTKNL